MAIEYKDGTFGETLPIDDAMKEYEALTTTRKRQLEKPLQKIESLRTQRKLPVAPDED